jgi:hypothetical protein
MNAKIRAITTPPLNIGNDSSRAIPNSFHNPDRVLPSEIRIDRYDVKPELAILAIMVFITNRQAMIAAQLQVIYAKTFMREFIRTE